MSILLAAVLAMQAEAPTQAAPPGAMIPAWMAGCWEHRSEDRWTEECWTAPRGAMMMGSSRSGQAGTVLEWETMQIFHAETDDPAVVQMEFWGSPRGMNRTMFAWVPSELPGITFVNAGHDYPQRIRYWREGRDLLAEISMADGSKPRRWRYSPAD